MFVFTVEFARSSGHYKWYRESRCHRYLLSEFQEIFSQLYDWMKYHKEHCYNQNIRHGSCLCEICENCVLFAKALNTRLLCPLPTNSHELIARFSCNLQVIVCVMDRCRTCEKEKRNRKRKILTKKCKFFPYKVKKPARLEIS